MKFFAQLVSSLLLVTAALATNNKLLGWKTPPIHHKPNFEYYNFASGSTTFLPYDPTVDPFENFLGGKQIYLDQPLLEDPDGSKVVGYINGQCIWISPDFLNGPVVCDLFFSFMADPDSYLYVHGVVQGFDDGSGRFDGAITGGTQRFVGASGQIISTRAQADGPFHGKVYFTKNRANSNN